MITLRTLDKTPAKVISHSSFNFVKGVVNSRKLLHYLAKELTRQLADLDVVKVEGVSGRLEEVLRPTPTLFITFDSNHFPESLIVGWYNLCVKSFIPLPSRCYHCQRCGHTTKMSVVNEGSTCFLFKLR